MNRRKTIVKAFYRSFPVMAGYIVLGTGFGILLGTIVYMILIRFI